MQNIAELYSIVADTLRRLSSTPNNQGEPISTRYQSHVKKLFVTSVEQKIK